MTAITSDLRIVTANHEAPRPRKMSGLGIDFSPVGTPPGGERSRNYFWPEEPSPFNAPLIGTSRWSGSTEQSATPPWADSSHRRTSLASSAGASRHSRSRSVQVENLHAKSFVSTHSRRQSEVDADTFIRMHHHLRQARASDDSQDSYGPLTPQQELDNRLVRVADILNFGEAPRKAPLPPAQAQTIKPIALLEDPPNSTLRRRPSASQSMLRTLSSRRKETKPPPPLTLAKPASRPSRGAQVEVSPFVHRLDIPLPSRSSDTHATHTATSSPRSQTEGPLHHGSPRPASRDSTKGSSKGSIGSLFRNVRRSISSVARKNSASGASGTGSAPPSEDRKLALQRAVLPPIKQKVAVSDYSAEATSLPVSPYLGRGKQPTLPSPRLQTNSSSPPEETSHAHFRPGTAPTGARTPTLHVSSLCQHVTTSRNVSETSSAHSSLPVREVEESFEIEYRDPWAAMTSTFKPASSYANSAEVSPSLPSWLPAESIAAGKRAQSVRTEAHLYKQSVLDAEKIRKYLDTHLPAAEQMKESAVKPSFVPAGSAPSYTFPSGSSSPDATLLKTSSRSFLNMDPSPVPLIPIYRLSLTSSPHDEPSISKHSKKRLSSSFKTDKKVPPPVFTTPGNVQMRNPWLAQPTPMGDSAQSPAVTARAGITPSSGSSSRSPALVGNTSQRRSSRKPAPKIDEADDEELDMRSSQNLNIDIGILEGERSVLPSTMVERVSEIPLPKQLFAPRPSLPDVYGDYTVLDRTSMSIPKSRSRSFAAPSTVISDGIDFSMVIPHRPSYATVDSFSTMRRSSLASDGSMQTFPSRPTRLEVKRLPLNHPNGIRISFDGGVEL